MGLKVETVIIFRTGGQAMKKCSMIMLVTVVCVCVSLAVSYGGLEVKEYSGFLGDYSQLKAGPEGGVAKLYMKEGVDFKKYTKVMCDEVRFYLKADAANKGISADEMKELSDKFHRAFIDAVGPAYPLVTEPGPDVLRVRAAITDLELPNPALNTVSSIVPAGIAISLVKKGITGKSTGVGEISMEFELLDSQSNERLAAGVDRRAGAKIDSFTKFASAEEAFKFWALRLRTRLDQFNERQTPSPKAEGM
jgi:hypothetical protein